MGSRLFRQDHTVSQLSQFPRETRLAAPPALSVVSTTSEFGVITRRSVSQQSRHRKNRMIVSTGHSLASAMKRSRFHSCRTGGRWSGRCQDTTTGATSVTRPLSCRASSPAVCRAAAVPSLSVKITVTFRRAPVPPVCRIGLPSAVTGIVLHLQLQARKWGRKKS